MKLSKTIKLIIIVSSFALAFLGLSIGSAFYTVNRSKASIEAIGVITIDENMTLTSAIERLDKAILDYDKLDRNLKLETKIDNVSVLEEKKLELVRVSILLANSIDQQKVKLNYSNNDVAKYVSDVDTYKNQYTISEDDFASLDVYNTYLTLKDKYQEYISSNAPIENKPSDSEASAPEIC